MTVLTNVRLQSKRTVTPPAAGEVTAPRPEGRLKSVWMSPGRRIQIAKVARLRGDLGGGLCGE